MKKSTLTVLLFITIIAPSLSQEITIGTENKIYSNVLNEERIYYISTPDNYNDTQAYPVLYVLDGHELFKLASSTVNFLTNRGFMPETIVVGINNRSNRDRDLTPTKTDWSPSGGGAENFLSFLVDELIPEIEKNYKTQSNRTIYGSSLGGLFAMYVLYNHPEVFDNYIAISPSLYHDKGLLFNHALKYFDRPSTNDKKFVFLSLADEVYDQMRINFRSTINLFKSKANSKNIRWNYNVYDSETHETSKLIGLNDGLRSLHEFWFVPFYQRDRGIEGLIDHYKLLNDLYSFNNKIEIPEHLVNRIGYNVLREGKPDAAYSLFKYNVEHFPDSANAYDSLAEYFERQKQFKEAKEYYELALKKAKEQNSDVAYYMQSIKRIEEILKN
ncbi:alpha/beta hydrolase-fold protein [Winogradskyella sp.]|uniref:alpha/beta hydrolase-fold protein n=1 Tax=Winogradskyella sp. TaxID=1883156 RepID=UPI0026173978|nr:alpha/beta hydrolase-fold protein [Winogradskyella sp.]